VLTRLKAIKGPKLLHVITTKGAGYKPAEDNPTVWHAPGHYDPETGETIKQDDRTARYQDVFGKTVTRLAHEDKRIVGITPAMLSGSGLSIMNAEMPDRVFDVGIAEGHAVTFSAGLAAGGMLPFCCIYSSFMQRAYDNAIHDVALQNLKVIFCLDRAGLVGEDGATHHGVFDLAAFRPVPNLVIASPRDEKELADLLYSATFDHYPATIIRYPRGRGIGTPWEKEPFCKILPGRAQLLHEDADAKVAVLSIGPVADKCRQAIEMANAKGVGVIHYDMRFLKPIDTDALDDVCSKADFILTVEDGCKEGGLHGAVAEYVASHKPGCRVESLGVPDEFISQGSREQLFDYCGYNTKDIFEAIISFEKK
ncbi:MAG: 1-deoxy-D-xylulose-5-phosphate synthase, partial [Bacteroidales bacterium]|nr:1-deoxy-D-xylulose-5-phosphate synthase [Bacteroidales bacterium]